MSNPFLNSPGLNLSNGTANLNVNQIIAGGLAIVPTMPLGDNSTSAASTAFVQNAISGGGGSGDMLYIGTQPTLGKHYKQDSLDGKSATDSKLLETGNDFDFGAANLINVDNINCTQVSIGTTEYKNQSITDSIEINLNAPFIKSNSPSVIFSETTQISAAPTKNLSLVGGSSLNLSGNDINLNSTVHVDITTADMNIISDTILTNSDITGNSFVKVGGTNIQYLMGDGSTLTASANSGNSNFYLYNSGTSQSPTPPSGYITYNNATQSNATIIYISHFTRDNFDIEVYFKQITTLTEVYVQDQNDSTQFIQYNITAAPTITPNAQITIPVMVNGVPGTTGFANGHNVFVSFFTNGLEVDTRLSALETKTQFQTTPSGNTAFSSNIDLSDNQLINISSISQTSGRTLNVGFNNIIQANYNACACVGTQNTISGNEQWAFGLTNNIQSNVSVAVGSFNTVSSFCGNAIGRTNVLIAPQCNAMGYNNVCSGAYSVAIGNDIANSTPHSVCLGDSAIATIYPNSLVCDLGTSAKPYKDIYFSGSLIGGGGGTYTFANAGTGTTLVSTTSGINDFKTCSITAGANVAISNSGTDIVISSAGALGTNTINVTSIPSSASTYYPLFSSVISGNLSTISTDGVGLSYIPATNTLTAGGMNSGIFTSNITPPSIGFQGHALSASQIQTTANPVSSSIYYPTFVPTSTSATSEIINKDVSLSYRPSDSKLMTSIFEGTTFTGTGLISTISFVGTATNATQIQTTANPSSTSLYYPTFVSTSASNNNEVVYKDVGLSYRPSDNTIFCDNVNAITFTSSTAIASAGFVGTCSQALKLAQTAISSSASIYYPVFSPSSLTSTGEAMAVESSLTYQPSTNTLTAGVFVGNLTGTASNVANLSGGTVASIPYQSAVGTTTFLANGGVNQVLISGGGTTPPSWSSISAIVRGYVVPFSSGGTAAGYQYAQTGMFGLVNTSGTSATTTRFICNIAGSIGSMSVIWATGSATATVSIFKAGVSAYTTAALFTTAGNTNITGIFISVAAGDVIEVRTNTANLGNMTVGLYFS